MIEFRIALTADDYEKIVGFYRDGLGLDPGEMWTDHGRGQVLHAGRATLEILDTEHAAHVDEVEIGQRVSGPIRFAFEVPDIEAAVERALDYGATLLQPPTLMPWGDRNARLESPDGMQVTLFESTED